MGLRHRQLTRSFWLTVALFGALGALASIAWLVAMMPAWGVPMALFLLVWAGLHVTMHGLNHPGDTDALGKWWNR